MNFITNRTLPVKNRKLLKPIEHLFHICTKEGLQKTKEILYEAYPSLAVKKDGTIMKNLIEFNIQKQSKSITEQNIFIINNFDLLD
jgi:hypothetical protein